MLELKKFDANKSVDWSAVWQAFDKDGGLIVENFIAPELLQRLQDDFSPLISEHKPGSNADGIHKVFHGDKTKRITGLPKHSSAWVELLCDKRYNAMADRYLGENDYWLNTAQLISIGPNESAQTLHRDELNWPQAMRREKEITVTALFAISDFTEQNGATVLAPGSNHWDGRRPDVPEGSTCQAVMPAGSALFYCGKIVHGGGANTTKDHWRVGLHAGFCLGWLRAEENFQLTVPLDVARTLPERAQYLLGFRSYNPKAGGRLGLVDYDDAAHLLV